MKNPLKEKQEIKDYLEIEELINNAKSYYSYIRKYVKLPYENKTAMSTIDMIDKFFDYGNDTNI